MQANFIHLRLHTEYSLSDSLITIPGLMKKVTAFNMPAIAITDLSNMYATIKLLKVHCWDQYNAEEVYIFFQVSACVAKGGDSLLEGVGRVSKGIIGVGFYNRGAFIG